MSNETIEAISQRSREAILGRIKNTAPVEQCSHDVDYDPVAHIVMQDDLIENLKNNMTNNKFIVHDIDEASLIDTINAITKEHGLDKNFIYGPSLALDIDKINAQNKVCFDKAIEDVREEVFASSFSVIHAYAGVSSHGVACVVSSETQPRMLSLAPTLCIMLLKKSDVVKSLTDALGKVKASHEVLPSNILFIAGPSRTSDVELITVFGVHGSQIVHLLLY